jgi:hypothetical protein
MILVPHFSIWAAVYSPGAGYRLPIPVGLDLLLMPGEHGRGLVLKPDCRRYVR